MKITRKTYSIDEDIRTLTHQETYDDNGNVIHSLDYRNDPPVENIFEFNSNNQLISQTEKEGDIEMSAQFFSYNEAGEINLHEIFIGGSLYEKTVLETTENGFVRSKFQDGELVERLETIVNGDNWSTKFFHYEELTETQDHVFDAKNNSGETISHILEGDIRLTEKEKYNDQNEILLNEVYKDTDTLLISTEVKIENGLTISESIRDFSNGESYYKKTYQYDKLDNIVKFECRSSTGSLLSFHNWKYDSENRMIEENGFENGYFSGITGVHQSHDRFHLLHEYEECT